MPKAYWITCYREVNDPVKLAAYAQLGAPALATYDSAAYQEALAALDGSAVRDLRMVAGV